MGTCLLCTRPARKRGYCDSHYQTERRTGRLEKIHFPPRLREGWEVNRESLAWAAGLADGEGSFYVTNSSTTRSGYLSHFDVGQSSSDGIPSVLLRFQTAIGFGRLDGPRLRTPHLPAYKLQYNGSQQVQAVLAMLWPWLGDIKRNQAINSLRKSNV